MALMSTVRTYAPDLFTQPNPERAKAVGILDDMAERRREWLVKIRAALVSLYRHRVATWGVLMAAYVTADDADRLSRERIDLALPAGASPNLMGAVFRTREWQALGRDHVSSQPGSHGNLLIRWRYIGPRTDTP